MSKKSCITCDYGRVHEDGIYCYRYLQWVYNEDYRHCQSFKPWKLREQTVITKPKNREAM